MAKFSPLSPEKRARLKAHVEELKALGIEIPPEIEARISQPTLFDLPPEAPAPKPEPVKMPARLAPAEFVPSDNPAAEGPTALPAGFHLLPDERVRICPKCHQWAVAQERAPTESHPVAHVFYAHGVQSRVPGYREIVAIYHCIVDGELP